MTETIIYGILYAAFIIGFLFVLYLMFRPEKDNFKKMDTSMLVAMHTWYKFENSKKANDIAIELIRRGYRYEGNGVGVWTKDD